MIWFFMGFIFGIVISTVAIFSYVLYRTRKFNQKIEDVAKKIKDTAVEINQQSENLQKLGSLKYRLGEVAKLTEKQQELMAAHSLPSANSLHSRYKNQMNSQLKALEEQKLAIFQSAY